ncbi:hypothetical protein AMAG_10512 [Allomyces macrogynus ATCC 38327]|uniref:Uncharacterized protein n=1 Tax=Allomyces macrogynus (strain ATCC 38327) TaxID=578462 RepID=A0A0L0SV67_ALLM3|nr:hypothetical protein AMAG_10512 [Allomyces macrogynus ATCC 38327]|eukprot:KNE66285.1 hypothetical protein AMAG_10512 [Allomyces macrogynus ATCC 38327]
MARLYFLKLHSFKRIGKRRAEAATWRDRVCALIRPGASTAACNARAACDLAPRTKGSGEPDPLACLWWATTEGNCSAAQLFGIGVAPSYEPYERFYQAAAAHNDALSMARLYFLKLHSFKRIGKRRAEAATWRDRVCALIRPGASTAACNARAACDLAPRTKGSGEPDPLACLWWRRLRANWADVVNAVRASTAVNPNPLDAVVVNSWDGNDYEQGDVRGQTMLGHCYEHGRGVECDETLAFK